MEIVYEIRVIAPKILYKIRVVKKPLPCFNPLLRTSPYALILPQILLGPEPILPECPFLPGTFLCPQNPPHLTNLVKNHQILAHITSLISP